MTIAIEIHHLTRVYHESTLRPVIHPDKNTDQIGMARNRTILQKLEKALGATMVVICEERIKQVKALLSLEMPSPIKNQPQVSALCRWLH